MLNLSVKFDTQLMDFLKKQKKQPSKNDWTNFCEKHYLNNLIKFPLFENIDQNINQNTIDSFKKTLNFLENNLGESVKHVSKYFPEIPQNINHSLTICFLPYGKTNFGPKPSLQLYSLFPEASPYEAYLFLIHIYYHEISFLNYTEYCSECAENPNTPEKLKYYILTLIQNEGIGNFAVLNELLNFRDENPDYEFKYFTYANQLGNDVKVAQSMSLLRQMFNKMDDINFLDYKNKINLILKNKQLPIINLIGTHIARNIVEHHGLDSLKNVYNQSVNSFFEIYFKTEDHLKSRLLTNEEKNDYFRDFVR